MKLLIPLGLLGLISIIVLIVIYIIKPNYQQKTISTTYMWKLSLKYKKKRINSSKLLNILIVLCQIVILTCFALILARPVTVTSAGSDIKREVVAIIDASASMRTESSGVNRFERAVTEAENTVNGALNEGGYASVIIADNNPYFLLQRTSSDNSDRADAAFDSLADFDKFCTYGKSDVDTAVSLCDSILTVNGNAEIYLFTDVTYSYVPDGIKVVPVKDSKEWNAAILGAKVEMIDNFCAITVDVACYNRDREIELTLQVEGANGQEGMIGQRTFKTNVKCNGDATQSVMFVNQETIDDNQYSSDVQYYPLSGNNRIYSYKSIFISLSEDDNYPYDNGYSIYGGEKPVVRVQYTSTLVNNFFNGALLVLQNHYLDKFDLQISEVKLDNYETPALSGFDFYIFEHYVPDSLPKDGVIFLVDPPNGTMPVGANFTTAGNVLSSSKYATLTQEANSPLLHNVKADALTVSRYTKISNHVGYEVLLTCDTYPMLLLKDDGADKIMVMPFSVHYSNFGNGMYFPLFMHNVFEYFFPVITDGFAFEVGESVLLKSRGESLGIKGANGNNWTFNKFPTEFTFSIPGTYEVSQNTFYGISLYEEVFVKIPAKESNICAVEDVLKSPMQVEKGEDDINDLLVWFAAALVALLFIDWLLQLRSNV